VRWDRAGKPCTREIGGWLTGDLISGSATPAAWQPELGEVIKAEREEASVNRVSVNQCAQCRADIIAPEWSEHLSDHCIRHVWSCEACGYRFEDTVYLSRELADAS